MGCHICIHWTPENGCAHYGPALVRNELRRAATKKQTFTPEQRIEAYEYAMDRVDILERPYICCLLRDFSYPLKVYLGDAILEYFPEFAKHKPSVLPFEDSTMWWPENAIGIRKQVLQQCIEECLLLIKAK